VLRQVGLAVASPFFLIRRYLFWIWALQHRERLRLSGEMSEIRGLMQLLMKQRNGYHWTDLDRKRIGVQLRKLAALSPYLILFLSPGGFFALPVLAWWLDRRRLKRAADARQSMAD
jgi:hypothetical protein